MRAASTAKLKICLLFEAPMLRLQMSFLLCTNSVLSAHLGRVWVSFRFWTPRSLADEACSMSQAFFTNLRKYVIFQRSTTHTTPFGNSEISAENATPHHFSVWSVYRWVSGPTFPVGLVTTCINTSRISKQGSGCRRCSEAARLSLRLPAHVVTLCIA